MTFKQFRQFSAAVKYQQCLKHMKTFQSMLADVAAFHAAGEQPEATAQPTFETRQLRYKLMAEELAEFRDAGNRIDELDALIDLLYVVLGTLVAYDYTGAADMAWRRVHFANMMKFLGGIKRRADGKIIKPEGWAPPDLSDLV